MISMILGRSWRWWEGHRASWEQRNHHHIQSTFCLIFRPFNDTIELYSFVLKCCVFMRNVHVQVQKSPIYRREGINIHSNVFISVAQAILGGVTEVQGLYKPISLVVSTSWPTSMLMSGLILWCLVLEYSHTDISVGTQIPAGCQADQVIRLQGNGIRKMNSYSYGDHYAHIKIRVPK